MLMSDDGRQVMATVNPDF